MTDSSMDHEIQEEAKDVIEESVFDWSTAEVIAASSHNLDRFIRELYDAKSDFLHNISVLYDGFAAGRFFGLRLTETEDMFRYKGHHRMFM